jgi:hypothetical protein
MQKDKDSCSDCSNESNDGRQGFYVGGAEHSGQMVLGPKKDDEKQSKK